MSTTFTLNVGSNVFELIQTPVANVGQNWSIYINRPGGQNLFLTYANNAYPAITAQELNAAPLVKLYQKGVPMVTLGRSPTQSVQSYTLNVMLKGNSPVITTFYPSSAADNGAPIGLGVSSGFVASVADTMSVASSSPNVKWYFFLVLIIVALYFLLFKQTNIGPAVTTGASEAIVGLADLISPY